MRKFLSHIRSAQLWIRLAYMLGFLLLLSFVRIILLLVIGGQFLTLLLTGSDNKNLRNFGQSLASWIFQIMQFLTFNSNSKPFPFDDWPNPVLSEGFSIDDEPSVTVNEDAPVDESDIPSFTSERTFDVDTEVKGSKKT
jgi:hypothetical protein